MEQYNQEAQELIERLRNNECSEDELQKIRQWIDQLDLSDPANTISPPLLEELKARMHQQLMHSIKGQPVIAMNTRLRMRRLLVAASVLVLVVSGIVLWAVMRKPVAGAEATAYQVIENNKKNSVRQVTLPDGTQVWLNRLSRLEFDPAVYNRSGRFVKLSGEGFFEVAPDVSRPFIVQTDNLQTKVLGTAFNIEAYQRESEIRVSLVQGKVALSDQSAARSTILEPNQTLRYSKGSRSWEVVPIAVAKVDQWRGGQLVFNELPLAEAIERINEQYDLNVLYDAALLEGKRITGIFASGNGETVLQQVLFVHGLVFKKTEKGIRILQP